MASTHKKTDKRSNPRKPPQPPLEITIESLNGDGIGVVREQGGELWVPGTLPGELVRVKILREGLRSRVGELVKVVRRSQQRTTPACALAGSCPGCPLMHMGYYHQAQHKQQQVKDALQLYPELKTIPVAAVHKAENPLGYRTTAKLALAKIGGKAMVGLYKRGTHEVIDIGDCPQHHPLINAIAQAVREEIEKQDVYVYNSVTKRGLLRYLAVRVSPRFNKALVTFVTSERNYREITHLAKWLRKKVPEVIGVHQNINPSIGTVVFGPTTVKVLGASDLIDQVGEVSLRLSPSSFFQVNHEQARFIYTTIAEWAELRPGMHALDIYCGVGGIAMHMARSGAQVTGIEINPEAISNAKAAAILNHLPNCSFVVGDAKDVMPQLASAAHRADVAVINPPRSGCDNAVLDALLNVQPQQILYVSCNPHSLARDLHYLSKNGYRIKTIQPVDMFPQTPHVETLVRLVRNQTAG
ncbi:MAG: 23S rRNA (uracil(1939)-C(5))-methyltransferase RlmD [Desulfuromonadaceae bacterium]|nr:23S rRNA (uracil(1939)-C(5))-methyltransferase RlmD [Desulfuromonas sp.]MDY0185247.1 23S rRNA (uracil(1939)-C(5))-methyltransferase RlmD [Desulfuromonadaceae bacterium]